MTEKGQTRRQNQKPKHSSFPFFFFFFRTVPPQRTAETFWGFSDDMEGLDMPSDHIWLPESRQSYLFLPVRRIGALWLSRPTAVQVLHKVSIRQQQRSESVFIRSSLKRTKKQFFHHTPWDKYKHLLKGGKTHILCVCLWDEEIPFLTHCPLQITLGIFVPSGICLSCGQTLWHVAALLVRVTKQDE